MWSAVKGNVHCFQCICNCKCAKKNDDLQNVHYVGNYSMFVNVDKFSRNISCDFWLIDNCWLIGKFQEVSSYCWLIDMTFSESHLTVHW